MTYINSDMLRHLFEVWKEIEEKAGNDKGAYCYNECINAIDKTPSADVVEVEPLKTYITNLISNIPQTGYVKDDYDAGFADALRIIYTHLCGERKETE